MGAGLPCLLLRFDVAPPPSRFQCRGQVPLCSVFGFGHEVTVPPDDVVSDFAVQLHN
jgi:hypothetical protein